MTLAENWDSKMASMPPPGIALALGGGGLFGAYQAGLWAGLQPSFKPAHVFGASIGAFNGLAVASGCRASELTAIWLDFQEAAEARWRLPWPPWSGCLDTDIFNQYLRRHFTRFRPVLPASIVVTRLWPLEPFVVSGGDLTWRHLAASCSVPVIMPPCPGFYHHPQSIEQLVAQFSGRILEQLGLPHDLYSRWG